MPKTPVLRFTERRLLRAFETGRIVPFLVLSITLLAVGSGVLMWLVDRKDFPTLGLALWWATSTVTTVGYGDVVPVEPAGRFVATGLMIVGYASLSLLTGIVASLLVQRRLSAGRGLGACPSRGAAGRGRAPPSEQTRLAVTTGGAPVLMNPLNDRTEFGRADAEEAARSWWIFLFAGITSIVFGALILSVDWSVDSLATFVGILFFLQGAWLAVTPSLDGSGRWSNMGAGALAAAAGIALIVWPDKGLQTVGVFIGIFVLCLGTLHIVGALANRHVPNWWLMLVLGLVELPIGIWAIRRPGQTVALLVTLAGAWAIV